MNRSSMLDGSAMTTIANASLEHVRGGEGPAEQARRDHAKCLENAEYDFSYNKPSLLRYLTNLDAAKREVKVAREQRDAHRAGCNTHFVF